MVTRGDVLTNPPAGQTLRFRRTAADTGGELLEMESVWSGGETDRASAESRLGRPPAHYHPAQEERFEMLEGRVRVSLDGVERDLEAGDTLVIRAGTRHAMWAPYGPARARWLTTPALSSERFYESMWSLGEDGRVTASGTPPLLRVAPIVLRHRAEFRLASPPWWVQRTLFTVLWLPARLLGYRSWYDRAAAGSRRPDPGAGSGTASAQSGTRSV